MLAIRASTNDENLHFQSVSLAWVADSAFYWTMHAQRIISVNSWNLSDLRRPLTFFVFLIACLVDESRLGSNLPIRSYTPNFASSNFRSRENNEQKSHREEMLEMKKCLEVSWFWWYLREEKGKRRESGEKSGKESKDRKERKESKGWGAKKSPSLVGMVSSGLAAEFFRFFRR